MSFVILGAVAKVTEKDNKNNGIVQTDAKMQERIENILKIINELDAEFTNLLGAEMSQLQAISAFAQSVQKKLERHYAHVFPKKCNNCGKIYETREEYLRDTERLARTTTIFDVIGLQEYRNCACGSTLIVWTQDRRDNTEYGVARRRLFDECLVKMQKISGESEEEIREKLRKIFSSLAA